MQNTYRLGLIISIGLLTLLTGCAERHYLKIDYNVPSLTTTQLVGQEVQLAIRDMRKNKAILSPGAAELFPEFKNRFHLTWITPGNQRKWSGTYPLPDMLSKIIRKRLEQLGGGVADSAAPSIPRLTLTLKELDLNQLGVMWHAALSCEAVLTTADGTEAKELVTGSAKRARVVGLKGADKLLSEIITDVLNRIDLIKLFQNAKLI